jgi:HD superfamily phosphohydrolase
MAKHLHEIRDPIHNFVRIETSERKVLDSRPFQRLRHIHQLAMTYLIYPGATHRRFEHSLGVMDLAGRVYDVVTNSANLHDDSVREIVPPPGTYELQYWRRVVRMAALCHDIGHLPFSHAGEDLLPDRRKHEHFTIALIESDYLRAVWDTLNIKPVDVAKLAVGPDKYSHSTFTDWEAILSEIIIGDAFGVDRIDYLLRDSHHTGVAYGMFDHNRLIDNLRILPKSYTEGRELSLGIDQGGIHAAEALLLARYFMYAQVYLHPVRRIYDHHLVTFVKTILPKGQFSLDLEEHLRLTDNEVMCELFLAARDPAHAGHVAARLIIDREHFQLIYERNPLDVGRNREAGRLIATALAGQIQDTFVHYAGYRERSRVFDFPVLTRTGVSSSSDLSEILQRLPVLALDFVYVARNKKLEAERWLNENKERVITPESEPSS